jgi:signal transduction histidine kinase
MAAPSSEVQGVRDPVLVLAPVGRDGALVCAALNRAGIRATLCAGIEALCEGIVAGSGPVLFTEEVLTPRAAQLLLETLERQPPWSDLPLVVLTTAGQATSANARTLQLLGPYGNVSLLERPVRTATLVAAVRTALRARRRQYDSRDYLTMRERVVAELGAARIEAERVSQAKDHFLAMLGHELRNPLAAIVSGLAVLERFSPQGEAEKQARAIVHRQVRHLTRLVDDLLDVSRIMSGKITLRRAPVDLQEIVRQCVESRQVAGVRAHDVSLVADTEPVIVDGDAVRLEQIVSNLLDNAFKYSPPGRPIRVLVRREGRDAVLRVRDRGIGLAPDTVQSIFELFTQVKTSLHRREGGLGLGLAVARGLVEHHGGSISAYSAGLGEGCEFFVRLPLSTASPVPLPDRERPASPPRRIVLVEDHADSREALQILLALDGHQVEAAADGRAGVGLILDTRPEIALIDVGLPELDGYEVARQVRRASGSTIRLIALTGYGQSYDRTRAQDAGFDLHLTKPVEPEELRTVLGAI